MALTEFQVLDNAVEGGGVNLGSKALVGSNKAGPAMLSDLCTSGLLSKSDGKTPKYSLTSDGRTAWEQQADDDRRKQVKDREQAAQRKLLVDFLSLAEAKKGKALTKPELVRFPSSIIEGAVAQKLVEAGTKKGTFLITAAGAEVVAAEQPLERQLERIRQSHLLILKQWRAAHQQLQQDVDQLRSVGDETVQAASAALFARGEDSIRDFEQAIAELQPFSNLLAVARRLRENADAANHEAARKLEEQQQGWTELQNRVAQAAEKQSRELHEFERRIETRLDEITRIIPTGHGSHRAVHASPENGAIPPEAAVWGTVQAVAEVIRKETLRLGGIVKIPDLTDRVLKEHPTLKGVDVHDFLQKWQREDRLTLQLCNDPRLEPRAGEGIHSPRGVLLYVQMR